MENQLFNWYKSRFNAIEEAAPADAWKNIHAQLHPVKKNRKGLFFWLSFGAILLIGSGVYISTFIKPNKNIQTAEKKGEVKSFHTEISKAVNKEINTPINTQNNLNNNIKKSDLNIQSILNKKEDEIFTLPKNTTSKNLSNFKLSNSKNGTKKSINNLINSNKLEEEAIQVNTASHEVNLNSLNSNKQLLTNISAISFLSPINKKIEIENNLPALNLFPFKELPFNIKNTKPSFFVGLFYERHINFLLNHDFLNYIKSSYKDALQSNFGSTYGIIAGRSISNKMQLIGEFYWNKSEGQGYMLYQNGAYRSRSILLDYSGVNILANHAIGKPIFILKKPITFRYIYGSGFTFLKNGNLIEESTTTIKNNFSAFNMSLIIGAESEIYFTEKFSLAISIRGYSGLLNINKGNENTPKYFNRTHTANVSLNTGLRYRF